MEDFLSDSIAFGSPKIGIIQVLDGTILQECL
jgi:hypothetical protein